MMTKVERLAYSRGYQARARHLLPKEFLLQISDDNILPFLRAAIELRDAADALLAVVIPDEEPFIDLDKRVNDFDAVTGSLAERLRVILRERSEVAA